MTPLDDLVSLLNDHLFIPDRAAYGGETCGCGWRCQGWDAERYETHLARAILGLPQTAGGASTRDQAISQAPPTLPTTEETP